MNDIDLDAEVVTTPYIHEAQEQENTQLAVRPEQSVSLFGTSSPAEVIAKASEAATALSAVIEKKQLYKQIGPKKHIFVEGWTLLGSILGVFPVCVWTKPVEGGWEARVEARRNGEVVGAAEAQCLRAERNWKDRDDFALRSMAQTRATSKALRMPLGFVVTLAGYSATPADEMSEESPTEDLRPKLEASIEQAKTRKIAEEGPISVSDLAKKAGWGDIGEHTVLGDLECPCGSMVIRRETKDGKTQDTCELSWRAFLKQPGALELIEKANASIKDKLGDKGKHYYKIHSKVVTSRLLEQERDG